MRLAITPLPNTLLWLGAQFKKAQGNFALTILNCFLKLQSEQESFKDTNMMVNQKSEHSTKSSLFP
jgi:hypothetical protein